VLTLKSVLLDEYIVPKKEKVAVICPKCDAELPKGLTICWNCGKIMSKAILRVMNQDS
jgi:predicted amidophosphoribosyltransferase